ncbi:glycoside hydrolase family 18 protein [Coniophora puteana RWD-64-598 SS2]|uniref:chitinase n=1 Tax=Coniophora puteana (strain RWD-64-598) TaxID=741705 RepID=A0A5M3MN23_CONPW|nr:glycoside hydrolase family 18 protein [Coniophora puteana RWD-64-598 SS2]EIW80174.1 glycoside hydrolase family 18 protein [Coniophora puteana RWD-64-598 SS2]
MLIDSAYSVFDAWSNTNLAVYWGQDSSNHQKDLRYYCEDDTIDIIPLAFLYVFFGDGGYPVIDFANTCNQQTNATFTNTTLADCSFMASDIQYCQSRGKIVTLSLGGGTGVVSFTSDDQAKSFADQVWKMFLAYEWQSGGVHRPFGWAALDGVDLDIESGTPAHYAAFVNQIRTHELKGTRRYFVSAAPQCPYPDENIGSALDEAPFDAVFVQFYNNYCALSSPNSYNFNVWDDWARNTSYNPSIKVYIGAPASNDAGWGYVNTSALEAYVHDAQEKYSSFGGVMLWDASEAHDNDRYDLSAKKALQDGPHAHSGDDLDPPGSLASIVSLPMPTPENARSTLSPSASIPLPSSPPGRFAFEGTVV